jgi:N-acetylneuraminic acid mutarotase
MSKVCTLMLAFVFLASIVLVANPVFGVNFVGNSWVEKAPMDHPRSGLGVVGLNGKIWAIGGDDQVGSGGSNLFPAQYFSGGIIGVNEEYDPSANNWTSRAPMPTTRMNFAITAYQNKIFCIGGNDNYNSWTGANEVYDPATNKWEPKAALPTPRSSLQANVVGGKIYCIGGIDSNGQYSTVNEVYDPAANSWSTKSSMPCPAGGYASAVFDGKIYIIGGYTGYAGLNLTQIYNPQNDSWTLGTPPPVGEICVGAATSGEMAPERIYCLSGRTQIYDPENNSWLLGAPVPFNIGGSVANVDDQLYVLGGVTFTSDLNGDISTETEYATNQQYRPAGYGTPDPAYLLEHFPPKISILSPMNQTYHNSSLSLVFRLDKAVEWTGYSIDRQQNITTKGNTTIVDVANGLHSITVYANDTYGNMGSSEIIAFTVAKPALFPTATALAVSAMIAIVMMGIALLVYFKKRKPKVDHVIDGDMT